MRLAIRHSESWVIASQAIPRLLQTQTRDGLTAKYPKGSIFLLPQKKTWFPSGPHISTSAKGHTLGIKKINGKQTGSTINERGSRQFLQKRKQDCDQAKRAFQTRFFMREGISKEPIFNRVSLEMQDSDSTKPQGYLLCFDAKKGSSVSQRWGLADESWSGMSSLMLLGGRVCSHLITVVEGASS